MTRGREDRVRVKRRMKDHDLGNMEHVGRFGNQERPMSAAMLLFSCLLDREDTREETSHVVIYGLKMDVLGSCSQNCT